MENYGKYIIAYLTFLLRMNNMPVNPINIPCLRFLPANRGFVYLNRVIMTTMATMVTMASMVTMVTMVTMITTVTTVTMVTMVTMVTKVTM